MKKEYREEISIGEAAKKTVSLVKERIASAFLTPEQKKLNDFINGIEATQLTPNQFVFFAWIIRGHDHPITKVLGGKQVLLDTFGVDLAQPMFIGIKPDEKPKFAHYLTQTSVYKTQRPGYYYLDYFNKRDNTLPTAKKESDLNIGINMAGLNYHTEGIIKVGAEAELLITSASPTFSIEDLGWNNEIPTPEEKAQEELSNKIREKAQEERRKREEKEKKS